MTELVSNSTYLTVLEAAALENVGWYVRILSQRDYATVVGQIDRFVDVGFTREANHTGGGKVTLDTDAPLLTAPLPLGESVPVIEQEALWQILEDGIVRAEFLAEDVVEDVVLDSDGRRGTVINGRGTGLVLEWAKVLPEGMPNPTSTERTFNAHPMAVWLQLLGEAQADGYLTWVEALFTDGEDSAAQPWGPAQEITVQAGEDLLKLLNRWCEQGEFSWRMLPGFKLQVFKQAGHHRENEVVFPLHRGQRKHDRTITRRDLANVVYADGGDGGIAIAASTSSQSIWRKRAAWVSAGDSSDATGRSAVANATLGMIQNPRVSRSVQVPIGRTGRRPFVDFDVHDWITIELPPGAPDSGANRVVGIAVEVGETGQATGELTLQSKNEVREVRLQRMIDKLGGSTTSGSGGEATTPIPVSKALTKARLADLSDVDMLGVQAGDVLSWDGAKFVDATPALGFLADVDATDPDEGDVLRYDGITGLARWAGLHLADLLDVEDADPDDGEVLTWDTTSGMALWMAPSGGGGTSDHGSLVGLGDDDHTQYALADGSRGAFAPTSHGHTIGQVGGLADALAGKAPASHSHALDDLNDVSVGSALDGQVLTKTPTGWEPATPSSSGGGASALDDLTDVGTSSVSDGDILVWDDTAGLWLPASLPAGSGPVSLDALTDVDTTGAAAGQVLGFDGINWAPVTPSTGGGGSGTEWGTLLKAADLSTLMVGTMTKEIITINISPDFTEALYVKGAAGSTRNLVMNVTASAAGNISLWWRRGTESNYDKLSIWIDGVKETGDLSGNSLEFLQFPVGAGSHTFEIRYAKDGSGDRDIDGAHIHGIAIP